jgi:tetratricopeptide (TPR) repeat protein
LSLIAYSNTFDSSFHFDDEHYIVKNPVIKDLRNFTQPSSSIDFKGKFGYKTFTRRYIGYLTFALNYRLHGLNVAGYHIVNIFVHICTALLLYFFIMLTFKTPSLSNSAFKDYERHIALFTALLFACHPLQTQAVTYIWQRVTSLCTMFYLLSLVAYIKWRLSQSAKSSAHGVKAKEEGKVFPAPAIYYLLSLASAILAMKTKELAFMLPVMIILYELIFFEGKLKKRVLYLIPFIITMLIIPLTLLNIDKPIGEMVGDFERKITASSELSQGEYLLTEFRVLVTYLRLIFLPVNQNLDYDYPRHHSFFNIEIFSSFIFLALIFGLSVYILFRYRDSAPHTRLISFGIIWFFINLLIESSIVGLDNVIFEHRMYLPSVGVFSALTVAIFMAIHRWKAYTRVIIAMLAIIIIALTGASYTKNSVWKDNLTLWQDVVNKSPNKARGYNNLGLALKSRGFIDKAIKQYMMAIKLNPSYPNPYSNLGNAYAFQGFIDKAIEQYLMAIKLNPSYPNPYSNLGNAYLSQGDVDKAIEQYLISIKLNPDHPSPYINLGNAYVSMGLLDMAITQYQTAIKLEPNNPIAHYNIGRAYHLKVLINSAIEHYLLAIKFKPDYPEAHHNLGIAYKSRGDTELAIREFNKALRLRPGWELPRKALEEISEEL